MTLRTKLILAVLLEIGLTITIVGLWAYQGSKSEIERLARDLLMARTEFAYAKCESYNLHFGEPTPDLKTEISSVRIATDGYIVAIDNSPGPNKGLLLIHPTDAGKNLNTPQFPHIQAVIDQIDAQGQADRYAAFTEYRQETGARGRQGEVKIAYYMYYKPWNWILLSSAYEADLFQSAGVVRQRTIQAISVMAILAVIVMTISIWKIFSPLKQLTLTTQEVANGKLDATFDFDSKDEIGDLARSFNAMLRSLQQNLRIIQEFEIARRMQMGLLPASSPSLPGLKIAARSMPATEVGGDFYDFIALGERKLGIIVGDVSGKGVSGAMVMSAAISALRYAAEERSTAHEILELANRRLSKDLQKHMFVAVFCGIIDLERGFLSYANAGQTLPIICRNGSAFFLPLPAHGDHFPLGIRHPICYGHHQIALAPNDLLIFYTDGIVDMMNGTVEPYSFERFSRSIENHSQAPLDEVIGRLVFDAEQWAGSKERFDDLTLLVARFEGARTKTTAATMPAVETQLIENGKEIKLTIPSQCGYEKLAMQAAAELAQMSGFPPARVEDLRTAVSEACLNAMEHGNALNASQEVDVVLKPEPHGLTVEIFDSGGGFECERKEMPDIERKIRGEESTGGLGLFLIEQLVDSVEYEVVPEVGHVTRLKITNVKTGPMPQVITSIG